MKLYRHHYLSVGIIIIMGIVDSVVAGSFDKDKIKKFIKSYVILFFQGLIELILGIISLVMTTKYFKSFDNFFSFIENLNKFEIFIFFS